jgi:hypothetical protein
VRFVEVGAAYVFGGGGVNRNVCGTGARNDLDALDARARFAERGPVIEPDERVRESHAAALVDRLAVTFTGDALARAAPVAGRAHHGVPASVANDPRYGRAGVGMIDIGGRLVHARHDRHYRVRE